jgi:hypothetical protein
MWKLANLAMGAALLGWVAWIAAGPFLVGAIHHDGSGGSDVPAKVGLAVAARGCANGRGIVHVALRDSPWAPRLAAIRA